MKNVEKELLSLDLKGVCLKCKHYGFCKEPCRPVALYLAKDNASVFEKTFTDEDGRTVSLVYSRSRETYESAMGDPWDDSKRSSEAEQAFSTENDNPFRHFDPKLKQTGIFIDRFFHGASYEDLAIKYETDVSTVSTLYNRAAERLLDLLKMMDDPDHNKKMDQYHNRIAERSGDLPKGQKWFLMSKVFGMLPSEIAEMEGMNKKDSTVRQLIIRVSDQLKAGEIRLIDCTPQESQEAKNRLDMQRAKRRERHARNKDAVNAKRRALRASKKAVS